MIISAIVFPIFLKSVVIVVMPSPITLFKFVSLYEIMPMSLPACQFFSFAYCTICTRSLSSITIKASCFLIFFISIAFLINVCRVFVFENLLKPFMISFVRTVSGKIRNSLLYFDTSFLLDDRIV